MRSLPAICALLFAAALLSFSAPAQEEPSLVVKALSLVLHGTIEGNVVWANDGTFHGTNGILVQRGAMVLTADSVRGDLNTGQLEADGHVHLETGDSLWVGEHMRYNYRTRLLETGQFRTGRPPMFASGEGMIGETAEKVHQGTNVYTVGGVYRGTNVFLTPDDYNDPTVRIHASEIKIVPGKYVEMWNAVVWAKGVPVFYFPYYKRNLGKYANNFNFLPGYRSIYGAYLNTTYNWYLNGNNDVYGSMHLDYRTRRGVGTGPDLNLNMGRWGEASLRYYYLNDQSPAISTNGLPNLRPIPNNRQRFYMGYQATPYTNVNVAAQLDYQSDPLVEHDFFEDTYRNDPQSSSFVEVNPYWENWSLDGETTPELNNFFDQVDRMPDVRLTGFRQEIGPTPFYYDSQGSAGYYRRYFAQTNGLNPFFNAGLGDFRTNQVNYEAGRVDTYHQVTLPWTFFDWLNVAPRVGGRLTYYGSESGSGATTGDITRTVFNTGMSTSFKASQLWSGATNSFLQIDGLRHVIEPSANYVYVPRPSATPNQLPQFDYDLPSILLQPINYPDYNNIDSIDSQNVIRFGLRNTLETKRDGQVENLVDWNLMLDWNLAPNRATNAPNLGAPGPQRTFDDLYSDLIFRPRTWLAFESQVREDINVDRLNLASHQITIEPSEKWSWGVGYWYLADGFPAANTPGANLISSTIFYRINDNYGLRAIHYFEPNSGHLQEQFYTLYRDFRSWTGALTFRAEDNGTGGEDYTIAFSFTLKFSPRSHLGDDTVRPYELVGE
jgi:LPS-assembly protein